MRAKKGRWPHHCQISLLTSPAVFFSRRLSNQIWLVVGQTPLKNMSSSVGMMTFPICGKIKHVPNHQPEMLSWWKWRKHVENHLKHTKLASWFATDPPTEFLNNLLIPGKLFNPAPMPSDFQGRPHRWCSRCQNDRWSYRHLLHLRKSRIRPWRDFEARAPSSRVVIPSLC